MYNPGSFSDVFNTDLGRRLWAYLNEHDNIIRMDTATFLERPAAEPLSPACLLHLASLFGKIGSSSASAT